MHPVQDLCGVNESQLAMPSRAAEFVRWDLRSDWLISCERKPPPPPSAFERKSQLVRSLLCFCDVVTD